MLVFPRQRYTMANKIPLAWHNLWHQPVRSGVAVVGVTFAAVLMFMQLGFLEAVKASATVIYDVLEFDICLRSRDYARFSDARSFDQSRLVAAHEIEGVATAKPLWVGVLSWRNPQSGEPRAILTLGVPEGADVFNEASIQGLVDRNLVRPEAMLVDTHTRREFGPADGRKFGPADVGRMVEINQQELEIAGLYTCGSGLNAGGAVIVNERDFFRCVPQLFSDQASLGLIDVAEGGDVYAVAERLRAVLPEDVEVLTRGEVLETEIRHWVWDTNYGLIFQSGVLVAVVVGTAIVYQVLASEVTSRMPEYATLKAIGLRQSVSGAGDGGAVAVPGDCGVSGQLGDRGGALSDHGGGGADSDPDDVAEPAAGAGADGGAVRRERRGGDSEGVSGRSGGAVLMNSPHATGLEESDARCAAAGGGRVGRRVCRDSDFHGAGVSERPARKHGAGAAPAAGRDCDSEPVAICADRGRAVRYSADLRRAGCAGRRGGVAPCISRARRRFCERATAGDYPIRVLAVREEDDVIDIPAASRASRRAARRGDGAGRRDEPAEVWLSARLGSRWSTTAAN